MYNYEFMLTEAMKIAKELKEEHKSLSEFEALQIAAKIQYNRIMGEAFAVHHNIQTEPAALERIAIELGADKNGDSIKSALFDLSKR